MVKKRDASAAHVIRSVETNLGSDSFKERVTAVNDVFSSDTQFLGLQLDRVMDNGTDIYVSSDCPLDVSLRGGLLLNLEDELCRRVDPDIRVWFEVTADKSKLRSLRGVTPVSWELE